MFLPTLLSFSRMAGIYVMFGIYISGFRLFFVRKNILTRIYFDSITAFTLIFSTKLSIKHTLFYYIHIYGFFQRKFQKSQNLKIFSCFYRIRTEKQGNLLKAMDTMGGAKRQAFTMGRQFAQSRKTHALFQGAFVLSALCKLPVCILTQGF